MEESSFLSQVWSWWTVNGSGIANGAIVLSAFAALKIIRSQRLSTRRRTTIDMIMRAEEDDYLAEQRDEFIKLYRKGDLAQYGAEEHKASEEAAAIRTILNHYETMAVAIHEGIADEEIYKRWHFTTIKTHWKSSEGYIKKVRARVNCDTIYGEFEELAKRWEKKPLQQKRSWFASVTKSILE